MLGRIGPRVSPSAEPINVGWAGGVGEAGGIYQDGEAISALPCPAPQDAVHSSEHSL